MVRFWVVAPYRNERTIPGQRTWHPEGFEQAWEFDKASGVIATGWYRVGDVSGKSRLQIKEQYLKVYGKERGLGYVSIQRFWIDIKPGDLMIARYGLKEIVGLGKVAGAPFYSLEKGKEWAGGLPIDPHPNMIPVDWDTCTYSHLFPRAVFQRATVSELKRFHKHWPTIKEVLSDVWNMD